VPSRVGSRFIDAAVVLLLILFFAALVIPPAYFLQGFSSWWAGLQWFLIEHERSQPGFFLGAYSQDGWWSYFLVAFLIKTPVGSLLLILAALVLYRVGVPLGRRNTIFLLGPVVFLFAAMTQAKINIGLRHILPVYPFLFLVASRLATVQFRQSWAAPLILSIPLALTATSSLRITPHQLAYFNELVGGPGEGYRYLSDSNLDWGQDLKGVKAYMEREGLPMIYLSYFGTVPPAHYGIRYQYVPGYLPLEWPPPSDLVPQGVGREVLAISVFNLQEVWTPDKKLFRWLYRKAPVAKIGYSIYVYDITGDVEAHLRLAEAYIKSRLPNPAASELQKVLALEPSHSEATRLLSSLSQ
jgi:hypothetical protein